MLAEAGCVLSSIQPLFYLFIYNLFELFITALCHPGTESSKSSSSNRSKVITTTTTIIEVFLIMVATTTATATTTITTTTTTTKTTTTHHHHPSQHHNIPHQLAIILEYSTLPGLSVITTKMIAFIVCQQCPSKSIVIITHTQTSL